MKKPKKPTTADIKRDVAAKITEWRAACEAFVQAQRAG